MKVAFDVAQTCLKRSGCPWYADSLARNLAASRDIDLQLLHHFGSWCNESTEGGTRIDGVASPIANLDEGAARSFWAQVAGEGLPDHPDIVHANSFCAPAVPGSKLVFTIYDLSFWLFPDFAQSATHVVCQRGVLDALDRAAGIAFISQSGREDFEKLFPGWLEETRRPTAVLHGASRFPAEARKPPAPDAPWLCLGSIEPRKNHTALLDGYLAYRSKVANPRPLVIAGGAGWASEAIHARIRSAASEGVRYLGYVDEDELKALYRQAFALIQPSWHEGFGLPVVEAMSFGLPAICSDIPTLREVAGDAAAFFPAAVPAELSRIMQTLHHDPAAVDDASTRAIRRSGAFSWEQTARCAINFYRSLLEADA